MLSLYFVRLKPPENFPIDIIIINKTQYRSDCSFTRLEPSVFNGLFGEDGGVKTLSVKIKRFASDRNSLGFSIFVCVGIRTECV